MRKFVCLLLVFAACPAYAGVRADLREGGKFYEDKKYGQALSKYNEALAKDPKSESAYFGAGAAAYYLKDYRTAEKAFESAAQQEKSLAQDALFNLGNAYYRAGDSQQAIQAFRQAIVKDPKDKEAIHNLQLILQQQQNQQNQNDQNQQNQDQNSANQAQQNQDGKGLAQDNQNQEEEKMAIIIAKTNDEMLRKNMYEAIEKIVVFAPDKIEISWKFDDLFVALKH